jgi:hypothetical protein
MEHTVDTVERGLLQALQGAVLARLPRTPRVACGPSSSKILRWIGGTRQVDTGLDRVGGQVIWTAWFKAGVRPSAKRQTIQRTALMSCAESGPR